jgi:predicted nuclease of predicted toxin-antitoxin system
VSIRDLLDENLPPKAVRFFAELGVDALHVEELGLQSEPDRTVWRAARDLDRILVTKDIDFLN